MVLMVQKTFEKHGTFHLASSFASPQLAMAVNADKLISSAVMWLETASASRLNPSGVSPLNFSCLTKDRIPRSYVYQTDM